MARKVFQVPRWVVKVVLELFAVVVGRRSHMTEYYYWNKDWRLEYCGGAIEVAVDVDDV
jgi:hypothetical protein